MERGLHNARRSFRISFPGRLAGVIADAFSTGVATAMCYGVEGNGAREPLRRLSREASASLPFLGRRRDEGYGWHDAVTAAAAGAAVAVEVVPESAWNPNGKASVVLTDGVHRWDMGGRLSAAEAGEEAEAVRKALSAPEKDVTLDLTAGELSIVLDALSLATATAAMYGSRGDGCRAGLEEVKATLGELLPIPRGHRSEGYSWHAAMKAMETADRLCVPENEGGPRDDRRKPGENGRQRVAGRTGRLRPQAGASLWRPAFIS